MVDCGCGNEAVRHVGYIFSWDFPIHRGAVFHQGARQCAPAIGAIIAGPRRGEACLALVPSSIPVRGMASSVPAPGFIPIHRGTVIHQGDACVALVNCGTPVNGIWRRFGNRSPTIR